MRFTNICGMTIPERMVALQEMMQSLINAVYGEYRWTANVPHVSSTNVFTAINIINFDDSDFIVGQTVLFTDGYLGVVIEVDNSKNPKQFKAGYYMEIRGPQGKDGKDGVNGTNGTDGRDALVQNRALSSANVTSPMAIPIEALNRTAVLGEPIVMFATDTTENKTYMLIGTVTFVGVPDVNPYTFVTYSSKVDITGMVGPQGAPGKDGAGLVKRYMHCINFYSDDDSPQVKFIVYSNSAAPFTNISPIASFLINGGFNAANKSYPASGRVSSSGNVWGVYSNSPDILYAQYGNMQNGLSIHQMPFTDNVIDLGS